MKNVIILLSVFVFLFVAGVGNAGNTTQPKPDVGYKLKYNKKGEISGVEIIPGGNCTIRAEGNRVNQELLRTLHNEHPNVEAIAKDVLRFSGSPDCIVYLGSYPICICCQ